MDLIEVNKKDFEIHTHGDEMLEFISNGSTYKFRMADLTEIRMSIYVYFDVKLYKENVLLKSGQMQLTENYYVPVSPNRNYIYIPFRKGGELINLNTGGKIESSINWFGGNLYNKTSTKMILNGMEGFKIIDLLKMKEVYTDKKSISHNRDAFFVDENIIWQIRGEDKIEEIDLKSYKKNILSIKSPFDKFGIDLYKYKPLVEQETHCLKLPEGGMAHSNNLNNWNYLNTKDKVIFNTLIPVSEIKYSKNYEREYCDVEYRYIKIKKTR